MEVYQLSSRRWALQAPTSPGCDHVQSQQSFREKDTQEFRRMNLAHLHSHPSDWSLPAQSLQAEYSRQVQEEYSQVLSLYSKSLTYADSREQEQSMLHRTLLLFQ